MVSVKLLYHIRGNSLLFLPTNIIHYRWLYENINYIFQPVSPPEIIKNNAIYKSDKIKKVQGSTDLYSYKGRQVQFLNKILKETIDGKKIAKLAGDFWSDIPFNNLFQEGGIELKAGKKPEKLIHRIIELTTREGDIILDYHLGSGTTTAVAHKLERQYIGIEQMNYIEELSCKRMQGVIDGEQGGISKSTNWQGGGEFIYCELAKWNETAKEMILECDSVNKLISLFDELYDKYFLNYNLKIKEFKEKIIREDNFLKLDLDDQKKMFITMLDLNQMYINKDDMDDVKFQLSKNDREITEKFYE
ncbi:MAG: DNA methyltransferase [Fusobacteriaceae bacterium]